LTALHAIKKTACAIGLVGLFALVLEMCARTDDWLKWRAPFWSNYSADLLRAEDVSEWPGRFGGQYEKWRLNRYGFRGPELALEKPPGTARVIVTGASEAFGLWETPGKEFPAQMQALLDEARPGRYEVVNASHAGMTVPRITHYFGTWLRQFRPDVVIVYVPPVFYLNDPAPGEVTMIAGHIQARPQLRIAQKARTVAQRLIPRWAQARLVQYSISRTVRQHELGWVWEDAPADRLALMQEHLEDLIRQVQAEGVRIILATHATRFSAELTDEDRRLLARWRGFYPRASEQCIIEMQAKGNQIIKDLGRRFSLPVVDVDASLPKSPAIFADFAHFTDQGAHAVAALFVVQLLEEEQD